MSFWIIATILTACAVLAILLPVLWADEAAQEGRSYDIEVYRDQLGELDRDMARGLIDGNEAEQARTEIGRRILGLTAGSGRGPLLASGASTRWTVLAAVAIVPIATVGIYGITGSPRIVDRPLHQRLAELPEQPANLADVPVSELVAKAEEQLVRDPKDGRGWAVLAPIYMRMGRFDDSARAFREAIGIFGSKLIYEAGLGEALVGAAGGVVTADAQDAFDRALAIDPADVRSRYYLATADVQDGRLDRAIVAWQDLLDDTEGDAPWRQSAKAALTETRRLLAVRSTAAPQSGPDRDAIEAASQLSVQDRNEMITSMVARLDQRLRENSDDLPGWKQLVRSYLVLGNAGEAGEALRRGAAALGEAAPELVNFGRSLGLNTAEVEP